MTEQVVYRKQQQERKSEVPVTILWNNSRMIRTHSISAAIAEILQMSNSTDVVKVNIVGNPGTGKSTLAETIAHLVHKRSKIPFNVKLLKKQHLINFEETLAKLEPINHVLIFDDISFLKSTISGRDMAKIEQGFTEIRHLKGGEDVKMICIFNFHYTMAVSKYLRQSDFNFYTTVGSSDEDHVQKLMGRKSNPKIRDFKKLTNQSIKQNKFTFQLGNKGKSFTYIYRQPFAPVLFFDGISLRYVVFPKRDWIDSFCLTCNHSEQKDTMTQQDLIDFDTMITTKFGSSTIKQAIKLKLFIHGISTQAKRVKQAMTFIDRWTKSNNCSLETLADHYGLKDQPTKLKLPKDIEL